MKEFICIVLIFLSACTSQSAPDNVIPKETMSLVIADLHLAESKVQNLTYDKADSAAYAYKTLENEIFTKYKITKAQYDTSYSYYSKNLVEFNEIYEKAIDSLDLRQSKRAPL